MKKIKYEHISTSDNDEFRKRIEDCLNLDFRFHSDIAVTVIDGKLNYSVGLLKEDFDNPNPTEEELAFKRNQIDAALSLIKKEYIDLLEINKIGIDFYDNRVVSIADGKFYAFTAKNIFDKMSHKTLRMTVDDIQKEIVDIFLPFC